MHMYNVNYFSARHDQCMKIQNFKSFDIFLKKCKIYGRVVKRRYPDMLCERCTTIDLRDINWTMDMFYLTNRLHFSVVCSVIDTGHDVMMW